MKRFAQLLVFTLMCVFTVSCMTATTTAEKSETKDVVFQTDDNLVSVVMSVKTLKMNAGISSENKFIGFLSYDIPIGTNNVCIYNQLLLAFNQDIKNLNYEVNDVGKQLNKIDNYKDHSLKDQTYDLAYRFKQPRDGLIYNYLNG